MITINGTQQSAQSATLNLFGEAATKHDCLIKLVGLNVSYMDDPAVIAAWIGWKRWDSGPGYFIEGVNPLDGKRRMAGGQFRPDTPYVFPQKNGKKPDTAKYLSLKGCSSDPLFLGTSDDKYWLSILKDPSKPIIITEGGKKAMTAIAAGWPAISISGVWNWLEDKVLSKWLKLFAVKGRTFYLAFDMDQFANHKVLSALRRLGRALEAEGATVKVMLWDEAHKGLDDYLLHAGLEAIAQIRGEALPFEEWWQKVSNVRVRDAERIRSELGSRLRYNEMSHQVELDGEDYCLPKAKDSLSYRHGVTLRSKDTTVSFLTEEVAKENTYHPVREYLEKVHTLYGDNTDILNDLSSKLLGAHSPLDQIFLVRWLISAVARAFEPGCKAECALILKGPQGAGKSTFFRTLASTKFFTDSVQSTSDKDALLAMHRFWMIEWSEVGTVFSKREYEDVKAFLSRQEDTLRRPYGTGSETLKRSFVIGASSNEDELFRDPTGNRRFWPITVEGKIDNAFVEEHRDRTWAAAVALYKAGEQWHLTPEEAEQAAERVKDYRESDPIEGMTLQWTGPSGRVRISDFLYTVLKIEPGVKDKALEMRVGKILRANGWERCGRWNKALGRNEWVYEKDWVGDRPD